MIAGFQNFKKNPKNLKGKDKIKSKINLKPKNENRKRNFYKF